MPGESAGLLRRRALLLFVKLLFVQLFWPTAAFASDTQCGSMDVYVRDGCPHCGDAKLFLRDLQTRYPDLEIRYHDVREDPRALTEMLALSRQHGIDQPGVPSFLVCGEFYVGFLEEAGSGKWLEGQLGNPEGGGDRFQVNTRVGTFSVSELGLPAFTVVLGLVDGFNPCAMWVLLFLLSILVNVSDRRRIVLVAGTFVLVSGLVYFAFMAAWLNLFLLIGVARWLQVVLGVLAIVIGVIHVKDFVAFGKGVSLSIPDSVKPSLYERVRRVLHAEDLRAALVGVTVVALMVNLVELLCTAGLPALYTQVLTLYPMTAAGYYGYLALYNLAYIVDDAIMVGIAVFTLNKFKLQEKQGRWLKLLSGLVVLTLGIILVAAPGVLV